MLARRAASLLFRAQPAPVGISCVKYAASFTTGTRGFSSTRRNDQADEEIKQVAMNDLPTLDQVVKDIYRKIHPDFFANYPQAREANEAAIKDLGQFLSDWKRRRLSLRWSPQQYKLTFFKKADAANKAADEEPIQKTTLNLHLGSSSEAVKSIQKILNNLGIQDQFTVEDNFSFSTADMNSSLSDFLFHYGRRVQDAKSKFQKLEDLVARKKTALETDLQLNEILESIISLSKTAKQLDISQLYVKDTLPILNQFSEMAELLKEKNVDLKGLTIYLDESMYADNKSGIIRLNWKETPKVWADYLMSADIPFLRVQNETHRQLREKSINDTKARGVKAADSLGVGSIYVCDSPYFDDEDEDPFTDDITKLNEKESLNTVDRYNLFLLSAVDYKIPRNLSSSVLRRNKKLELYIDCSKEFTEWRMDRDGNIIVHWTTKPQDLIKILDTESQKIAARRKAADELDTIRRYVGVRLGLNDLYVDDSFYLRLPDPAQKERFALMRLQENVDRLRKFELSGLEVLISDEFKVAQDGTLYIKWDSDIEKVGGLIE